MEVILVRHGKPDFPVSTRIASREIPRLIRAYDEAPLEAASQPPQALVDLVHGCECIVCSDLPRSQASAARLGIAQIHHSDPLFREARLPHTSLPLPKLSPLFWFLLFRALWFAGFSANGEGVREAKARARRAARKLEELAHAHGTVLFVGHGLFNTLIAKELLADRWSGPRSPGTGHWNFAVYRFGQDEVCE